MILRFYSTCVVLAYRNNFKLKRAVHSWKSSLVVRICFGEAETDLNSLRKEETAPMVSTSYNRLGFVSTSCLQLLERQVKRPENKKTCKVSSCSLQ